MVAETARRLLRRSPERAAELKATESVDTLVPRREPAIARAWREPRGIWGMLTTVSSQSNGMRQAAVAFIIFLIGGFDASLIRLQLVVPNNDFLNAGTFDQTITMHGSVMTFLFTVPFLLGIALMLLPPMLGARAVPWPRLTAFASWTLLFASVMLESSWLIHYGQFFHILPGTEFGGVPDTAWTAYVPLSLRGYSPNVGADFWLVASTLGTVGTILAASVLVVAVFKMRAPGMSVNCLPLFAWSILVVGIMILFAFIPQVVANLYLEFDRKFGTHFFDVTSGGPLLWQHLLWAFGNPDEYIEFIPAAGIVSTILPVVLRERINGYALVALSFVATGFISFGLWVAHMYTTGLPPLAMSFFMAASLVIAIPAGVQVISWLQTLWRGRATWNTPFLFMLGFIVLFVAGGITGVMLALIPFDWQMQDSYFVVAHLHVMILGSVVLPGFAAIYFWFPKFTGRLLDERIGRLHFWLMFIGINAAFLPQYVLGLNGMQRRIYIYPDHLGWGLLNLISSIGQLLMIAGVVTFVLSVGKSWFFGERTPQNPWHADTLEWAAESPLPSFSFERLPIVRGRHPLWDQEGTAPGGERVQGLVSQLSGWPKHWRAQIVVSAITGEPQEVARVGGSTIWPLIGVMGMTLLFASLLFDDAARNLVLGGGGLLSLLALLGWQWRNRPARLSEQELQEFERKHGVRLYPGGSPTISAWGVALWILSLAIALATAVFTYYYIRYNASAWPPDGIARPPLLLAAIGAAVLLASAGMMYLAQRSVRSEGRRALRPGLGATLVLGLAYLAIQVRSALQTGFTPATDSYGSAYYSLLAFTVLVAAFGLVLLLRTFLRAGGGRFTPRNHQTVTNTAWYWYFVVLASLAVAAVLCVTPYLG